MSWLKWVLGYCVLVGVGLWFGYRSRGVLPSQEAGAMAGYDPASPSQSCGADSGSQLPTG